MSDILRDLCFSLYSNQQLANLSVFSVAVKFGPALNLVND